MGKDVYLEWLAICEGENADTGILTGWNLTNRHGVTLANKMPGASCSRNMPGWLH